MIVWLYAIAMKRKFRLIYFSLIAGLFLLLAPILILYGMGFTYDFSKNHLQRTGSLYLRSTPADATITINEQTLTRRTPALINRLSEGPYEVSVTKEGSTSWSRRVTISPKKTEIFDTIELLDQTSTEEIVSQLDLNTFVIPDDRQDHFLFVSTNLLLTTLRFSFDPTGENATTVTGASDPTRIQWSTDQQNVAIPLTNEKGNELLVLNINPNLPRLFFPQHLPLETQLKSKEFTAFQWSPTQPAEIFLQFGQQFFCMNIVTKAVEALDVELGTSWVVTDQGLITSSGEGIALQELNGGTKKSTRTVISNRDWGVVHSLSRSGVLVVQSSQTSSLELLSVEGESVDYPSLSISATKGQWSPTGNTVLFWNEYELLLFDPEKKEQRLLLRSSKPIKNPKWFSQDRGILFQQGDEIKALLFDSGMESEFIVTAFEQPSLTLLGINADDAVHLLRKKTNSSELVRHFLKKTNPLITL